MRKGKEPTHTLGAVIAASADSCLRYGQPGEKSVQRLVEGFGIVNIDIISDHTDTYPILNV